MGNLCVTRSPSDTYLPLTSHHQRTATPTKRTHPSDPSTGPSSPVSTPPPPGGTSNIPPQQTYVPAAAAAMGGMPTRPAVSAAYGGIVQTAAAMRPMTDEDWQLVTILEQVNKKKPGKDFTGLLHAKSLRETREAAVTLTSAGSNTTEKGGYGGGSRKSSRTSLCKGHSRVAAAGPTGGGGGGREEEEVVTEEYEKWEKQWTVCKSRGFANWKDRNGTFDSVTDTNTNGGGGGGSGDMVYSNSFSIVPASKEKEINKGEKLLKKRLKYDLGCHMIVMAGDGNCQFRSAAYNLYGSEEMHMSVRMRTVGHMRKESEFYSIFFCEGREYRAYLRDMERDGTWGDELCVRAMADSYGCVVHIVTSNEEHWYLKYEPSSSAPASAAVSSAAGSSAAAASASASAAAAAAAERCDERGGGSHGGVVEERWGGGEVCRHLFFTYISPIHYNAMALLPQKGKKKRRG
eukprot:GHVQ01026466.1.p1 GENE.GHVQ01026466.1~~GHVQ01026466.1.p1  ORF type:complete len:460 (+),score=125.68 GHVQ01026466.1:313-1692(+)